MSFKRLLLLLSLVWFCGASAAHAGVQVISDGGDRVSLQSKTLSLSAHISGGFAATTLTTTFANDASRPFEAQLIAEAPPDAVVTGFAYWFDGRKVIARIVEKQRAAAIYDASIERKRDPALVEMLKRNLFRARINPVAPKAELRIEITWVQPLYFNKHSLVYQTPLRGSNESGSLDEWKSAIFIDGSPVDKVTANCESRISKTATGYSVISNGVKTLPENLTVTLDLKPGPASPLFATVSPSAKQPYFALLRPDAPHYDVREENLRHYALKGGPGYLTVGRGAVPAEAIRRDVSDVAVKLWAARKIDELDWLYTNDEVVQQLSTQYCLPSAITSWLAIPDSERVRLKSIIERQKREQMESDVKFLGPQIAEGVAFGRESTKPFQTMKSQFTAACRYLGIDSGKRLQEFYSRSMVWHTEHLEYGAFYENTSLSEAKYALGSKREAYTAILRLAHLVPASQRSEETRGIEYRAATQLAAAQGAYFGLVQVTSLQKAPDKSRVANDFSRALSTSKNPAFRAAAYWVGAERLAYLWAAAKTEPKMDDKLVQVLERTVRSFMAERATLLKSKDDGVRNLLSGDERLKFDPIFQKLDTALCQEIVARREDGQRAAELRARIAQFEARLLYPWPHPLNFHERVTQLVSTIRDEQATYRGDSQKIAEAQSELARLKGFSKDDVFENTIHYATNDWIRRAPEKVAAKWSEATYVTPDETAAKFYRDTLDSVIKELGDIDSFYRSSSFNAERYLTEAEYRWLTATSQKLVIAYREEEQKPRPNAELAASLLAQLDALQAETLFNKQTNSRTIEYVMPVIFGATVDNLHSEWEKSVPDQSLIAELEKRVVALEKYDGYAQHYYPTRRNHDLAPEEYGTLRVQRIGVTAKLRATAAQLKKDPTNRVLQSDKAQLVSRMNDLTIRMGDPLIAVAAPANCRRVVAIMPSGEIKNLLYNPFTKRWEARFDVPTYATEGSYDIAIIVIAADGSRQRLTLKFQVDLTKPNGHGSIETSDENWLLTLTATDGADRVKALLPWGETVDLKAKDGHVFSASVPLPPNRTGDSSQVTFVLTGKSHNRTELIIDMSK